MIKSAEQIKPVIEKNLNAHGKPHHILENPLPSDRFIRGVKTPAIYLDAPADIDQKKTDKHDQKRACYGRGCPRSEADNKKEPANQLDPGQRHRNKVDTPIRENLIGGHGFGELSRIWDFAHAGVNKHQPDVYSEKKRQIFTGDK
jgi:hypothetical protein